MHLKRQKNKVIRLGSIFALFLILGLGIFFFSEYTREEKEKDLFENILQEKEKSGPKVLSQKYKDMIGWIEIPDSEFSYPVMQTGTKGHRKDEPEFYLHSNVYGEYSFLGTPFIDSRCSLASDNLIIYGHNINGGRMFGYLQGYRQKDFYNRHPNLYFTKCENTMEEYEVVSVLITDTSSFMYSFTDIYTDSIYKDSIEKLLKQSIYETKAGKELKKEVKNADVEEFFHKEKFLTLSTCRTGEGKNSRLLVIAKKRKNGGLKR